MNSRLMLVLFAMVCFLATYFHSQEANAFDVSAWHDARSVVVYQHYFLGDMNGSSIYPWGDGCQATGNERYINEHLPNVTTRKPLVNDQVLQWYEDLGVTILYVNYEDYSDWYADLTPYSFKVMNHLLPELTFRYKQAQHYEFESRLYTGNWSTENVSQALRQSAPDEVDWNVIADFAGQNGADTMWFPYPVVDQEWLWDGWNYGQGSRIPWSNVGQPVWFRIIGDIDEDTTQSDSSVVTISFFVEEESGNFNCDETYKWIRFPTFTINTDSFTNTDAFDTIDVRIVPQNSLLVQCNESFNMTEDDTCHHENGRYGFGNDKEIRVCVYFHGNHDFYLYKIELWDEAYYQINTSALYESAHYDTVEDSNRDAIADTFRAVLEDSSFGKLHTWFVDEIHRSSDEHDLSAWLDLWNILQDRGLPPFITNGTAYREEGANLRGTFIDSMRSRGLDLDVLMTEFYPLGADSTHQPAYWDQVPWKWYTHSSSDVEYIDLDSLYLRMDPQHGRWGRVAGNGTMSLQAPIDFAMFGPKKSVYDSFTNPGGSGYEPSYPGLIDQVQYLHDRGLKHWMILNGGGTGGYDWDPPPSERENRRRAATYNEMRLLVWLSIAMDTDGIQWWGGVADRPVDPTNYPIPSLDSARQVGGLIEWTEGTNWCDDSAVGVVKSERYNAAKEALDQYLEIDPILAPLEFGGTTASRIYETHFTNLPDSLKEMDFGCGIQQGETWHDTRIGNAYTFHNDGQGGWEEDSLDFIQMSVWKSFGPPTENDFWLLVVNRRALEAESSHVKIDINFVNEFEEFAYDLFYADTTKIASELEGNCTNGAGPCGRLLELDLQPASAELIHFYPNDDLVITADTTIFAPFNLSRNIRVKNASVTILPDTTNQFYLEWPGTLASTYDSVREIYCSPGKHILFDTTLYNSKLEIKGNDSTRIAFQPLDPNLKWGGIRLAEGVSDTLIIQHASIEGAVYGLYLESHPDSFDYWNSNEVEVKNSRISDCDIGILGISRSLVYMEDCEVSNNVQGIRCQSGSDFVVRNCVINGNDWWGIGAFNSTIDIYSSTINENGSFGNPGRGLLLFDASAALSCTDIKDNQAEAIYSLYSSVLMGNESEDSLIWGKSCVIGNNSDNVQIRDVRSNGLILDHGYNKIYGETIADWILAPDPDCDLYWRENFWGDTSVAEILTHLPDNVIVSPVLSSWSACDPVDADTSSDGFVDSYVSAKKHVVLGLFSNALTDYRTAFSQSPTCAQASASIKGILAADLKADDADNSVQYYSSIYDTSSNDEIANTAISSMGWALAYAGELDSSSSLFTQMLDSAKCEYESVRSMVSAISLDIVAKTFDPDLQNSVTSVQASLDSIDNLIASLSLWDQYTISDSVVMYAPMRIDSTITVNPGGVLVVKPLPSASNHTITLAEGVSIKVVNSVSLPDDPHIYFLGTEEMPLTVTAESDSTPWEQIFLHNGIMDAQYTTFHNSIYAYQAQSIGTSQLRIDHCKFDLSESWLYIDDTYKYVGPGDGSYLRNCEFSNIGDLGYGFGSVVLMDGSIEITDCWFHDNSAYGLYLYNVGQTDISSCIFESNAWGGLYGGGATSDLTVSCSEFSYNGADTAAEVQVDYSSIDFSDGSGNIFADNDGVLLDGASMTSFVLDSSGCGFYLFDSTGYYIVTEDETDTMDVTGAYWYPFDPDTSIFEDYFDPDQAQYWNWSDDADEPTDCGVGAQASMGGGASLAHTTIEQATSSLPTSHAATKLSTSSRMRTKKQPAVKAATKSSLTTKLTTDQNRELAEFKFNDAVQYQQDGIPTVAMEKYETFIRSFPDDKRVPMALTRHLIAAKDAGITENLSSYYMRQSERAVNPYYKQHAHFLSIEAKLQEGKPDDALRDYEDILAKPLSYRDSVAAVIGAMKVHMDYGKQSDLRSRYPENNMRTHPEMAMRVVELTRSVHRRNHGLDDDRSEFLLPTEYKLYQNYPNPFNPSTEIRYDLPDAVPVQLRVYNILGQHVTTLVDHVSNAGAFRIYWDGKNAAGVDVASGMFIYQLKAGNFVDAKKMVLLR